MSADFYEVLGVNRDASEKEIKRAYREKAAKYHPDVSDDPNAEEKFKKIKKAKEVLTDDEKRRAYDQMGHDRFRQAEKQGGFSQSAGRRSGDPFSGSYSGGSDPFGDIGDIFEQFFGGGSRQRRRRHGADLRTSLEINLEDAFKGVSKQVTLNRPERCDDCNGSGHPPNSSQERCPQCDGRGQVTRVQQTPLGRVQQTQTCGRCNGEGTLYSETCSTCSGDGIVRKQVTLSVDIPAGIRDGQTMRMEGEGAPSESGGRNGDLLIEISIKNHDMFDREGDDIHYVHPISFPHAVFGGKDEIPTLNGSVEMEIPKGTQSGETFRLRGKGMPRLRGRGNGDQYVRVQVVTPEKLNPEQREALEQFAEAGGEEIDVEQGFFERIKNSF